MGSQFLRYQPVVASLFVVVLASCGGGGGGGGGGGAPAAPTYTLGGTVSGLSGTGLVLQFNGGNNLAVNTSGSFTFSTPLTSGSVYSVTVLTQPTSLSQTCSVGNGSGSIGTANVTNVAVNCVTNSFSVGGIVSGLSGSGLVLQNNGSGNISISANGAFTIAAQVLSGGGYSVTVLTQPTNLSQTCAVTSGSGTVGATNIMNVNVACVTNTFNIGVTVTGLSGVGLVLQNNGGGNLGISGNGSFTFASPIASGSGYNVTIFTKPTNQACNVTNGSGTVAASNITNVSVACSVNSFSIGTVADPLATQQWHLKNTGQTAFADVGGVTGMDINVDPVFSTYGYSGIGVTVAVVDTGLEIAHEDLAANVVPGGSWNFLNSTNNPTSTATTGDHGTSVAGLIGMAQNSVGGIGVASKAALKGFNFLQAPSAPNQISSLGGSSANPNSSDVYIFNQSLGLINPTTEAHIDPTVEAQYSAGVTQLRAGKGAIYVKSAGNDFATGGNANFDPYNTIPFQIVVAATNADGVAASYSNPGSAIWVSAPGGEYGGNAAVDPAQPPNIYQPAMVTTDQSGCTNGFSRTAVNTSAFNNGGAPNTSCTYTNGMNGTSSAAPVTSGTIALLLEANPALTWRDAKHILATTARKVDAARGAAGFALSNGFYVAQPAWITNAGGHNFHNWYGFGMVDALAAVNAARSYVAGQLGAFVNSGWISSPTLNLPIPDFSITGASNSLNVASGSPKTVEAVQISVFAAHPFNGDIAIELASPSGTRSVLKTGNDAFTGTNLNGMVLSSNAYYGESALGSWTIKLVDVAPSLTGTLVGWSIRVFAH